MFWLHGIVNSHIICGVCTTITYVHSPNCVNDSDHMLYKQLYTCTMAYAQILSFTPSDLFWTSFVHRCRKIWYRVHASFDYELCIVFVCYFFNKKLYIWNTTTKKETNVVCFWTVLTMRFASFWPLHIVNTNNNNINHNSFICICAFSKDFVRATQNHLTNFSGMMITCVLYMSNRMNE